MKTLKKIMNKKICISFTFLIIIVFILFEIFFKLEIKEETCFAGFGITRNIKINQLEKISQLMIKFENWLSKNNFELISNIKTEEKRVKLYNGFYKTLGKISIKIEIIKKEKYYFVIRSDFFKLIKKTKESQKDFDKIRDELLVEPFKFLERKIGTIIETKYY